MTHDELLAAILELAAQLGLLAYYNPDARRSQPGFPDLVIAGPGGALFREVKTYGDRLKPKQSQWRYTLIAGGEDWAIWYPHHWRNGEIRAQLEGLRHA